MRKILILAVAVLASGLAATALEVHFLRHGETAWNRAKALQGAIPYTDLTPRGGKTAAARRRRRPCPRPRPVFSRARFPTQTLRPGA